MKSNIELFGFTANLTVINTPLGLLKELDIVCDLSKVDMIINEAVKRNMPFERTESGVKLFQ